MKKTLVLLLLCTLLLSTLKAQRVSRDYRDRPMTEVLADLSRATTRQRIIFIHNDLEDYLVTQRFDSLIVADAIRACIGHYPISLSTRGDSILLVECTQRLPFKFKGQLVNEQGLPVADANIMLYVDTTVVGRGISNLNGRFLISADHPEGSVHISHIAYQPVNCQMMAGDMGTIRLQPADIRLDSVSVTTSTPTRAESRYLKYADKIAKKVWSMKLPQFHIDTIPREYRDAPAVVLAEYDSVVHRRVQRMIPVLLFFGGYPDPLGMIKIVHTNRLHRVRVYINSVEAALAFSKLQYNSNHLYNRGFLDRSDKTVWGIRIIHPNGNVRVVDTYKYFGPKATSDKLEKGEGHIDIGPLHLGDIIDYFWYKKDSGGDFFQYTFQQRYPILHLDYRIKADKQLCIEYSKENNAPDFTIKRKNLHYLFSYSNKCIEGNPTENLPRTKFEVDIKTVGIWSFLYDNTEESDSLYKRRRHGITDMTKQDMEE